MQYTLRNVPREVDRALRERAEREARSLNEVAIEVLRIALGLTDAPVRQRDLADLAGTWVADPEIEGVLAEQRVIEEDMWR
jgi:plasmid stability protein